MAEDFALGKSRWSGLAPYRRTSPYLEMVNGRLSVSRHVLCRSSIRQLSAHSGRASATQRRLQRQTEPVPPSGTPFQTAMGSGVFPASIAAMNQPGFRPGTDQVCSGLSRLRYSALAGPEPRVLVTMLSSTSLS